TERMVPCMSGGMSWIASFTDTWLKPQYRQISTTSAAAAASSGRVTWEADVSGMKRLADLCRLAVGADAGNLDDRCLRREAGRARGAADGLGHRRRRRFADRAAFLADEEHHGIAAGVIVHAGDEGVAALDAVHEALLAQEVERAVDRDRRRPAAVVGEAVDQVVGAERLVTGEQRLQHRPADRRQALVARLAERLGVRDRVTGAAAVVMTGGREDRRLACQGSLHSPCQI